jgi:hypothetical protein
MGGLMVAIHDRGHLPNFKYDGFTIAASMTTHVAISRLEYTKLGPPFGSCRTDLDEPPRPDDSLFHKMTLNVSTYSRDLWFDNNYTHVLSIIFIFRNIIILMNKASRSASTRTSSCRRAIAAMQTFRFTPTSATLRSDRS